MWRRKLVKNFTSTVCTCCTLEKESKCFNSLRQFTSCTSPIAAMNGVLMSGTHLYDVNIGQITSLHTSRRNFYACELNTAVTIHRRDGGSYPALLSWSWNTQRPRHLVVKIAEPASSLSSTTATFSERVPSSAAHSNAETRDLVTKENVINNNININNYNSSDHIKDANINSDIATTTATTSGDKAESFCQKNSISSLHTSSASLPSSMSSVSAVNENNLAEYDDLYFFGRLFLRAKNVAELLSVLIGWSPSAQIERERAGLMLRSTELYEHKADKSNGKNFMKKTKHKDVMSNSKVTEVSHIQSSLPLSQFTLTGYFTKKKKVSCSSDSAKVGTYKSKEEGYVDNHNNETDEQAVYIDNDLCTISVSLQESELMLLKNFLDSSMTNIFGIERYHYRKISEQMLERQRRYLTRPTYRSSNSITTSYAPQYRSQIINHSSSYNTSSLAAEHHLQSQIFTQESRPEPKTQWQMKVSDTKRPLFSETKESYARPFIISEKSQCDLDKENNDADVISGDNKNDNNSNNNNEQQNQHYLKENLNMMEEQQEQEIVMTETENEVVSNSEPTFSSNSGNSGSNKNAKEEAVNKNIDEFAEATTLAVIAADAANKERENILKVNATINKTRDDIHEDEEYDEVDDIDTIDSDDDDLNTNIDTQTSNVNVNLNNSEMIADEESIRDTDELDAEEVDADEELLSSAENEKRDEEETDNNVDISEIEQRAAFTAAITTTTKFTTTSEKGETEESDLMNAAQAKEEEEEVEVDEEIIEEYEEVEEEEIEDENSDEKELVNNTVLSGNAKTAKKDDNIANQKEVTESEDKRMTSYNTLISEQEFEGRPMKQESDQGSTEMESYADSHNLHEERKAMQDEGERLEVEGEEEIEEIVEEEIEEVNEEADNEVYDDVMNEDIEKRVESAIAQSIIEQKKEERQHKEQQEEIQEEHAENVNKSAGERHGKEETKLYTSSDVNENNDEQRKQVTTNSQDNDKNASMSLTSKVNESDNEILVKKVKSQIKERELPVNHVNLSWSSEMHEETDTSKMMKMPVNDKTNLVDHVNQRHTESVKEDEIRSSQTNKGHTRSTDENTVKKCENTSNTDSAVTPNLVLNKAEKLEPASASTTTRVNENITKESNDKHKRNAPNVTQVVSSGKKTNAPVASPVKRSAKKNTHTASSKKISKKGKKRLKENRRIVV